jgi:putative CocE/NonD family hydrolase
VAGPAPEGIAAAHDAGLGGGVRRVKKVLAGLPLGTADQRLVGHRVDYFQEWLAHEHDDEFWKRLDLRRNAAGMPSLVHLASGWYDVCLASVLADYRALREAGKQVRLVVGPWYHGRGVMDKTLRAEVEAWLDAAATGADPLADGLPVRVHVGGVDQWRDLPDWPPPDYESVDWHLHPDGTLADQPAPDSPPDRYRYDPAQPTPAVGGAMENFDGGAGAKDNRRLEQRADVLTYTSRPFEQDVAVIGPVTARIVFRSTLSHTDLLARVCDVHPDGRSVNLCDGVRRLRPLDPPADPDGTRTVVIDLIGIAHCFRAGHRLRLQVSSGAHPRLVRNTGTGEPLATATELRPADQEIFHDPEHPSVLTLPCAEWG